MDYERDPGSGSGGTLPDEPQADQATDGAPAESADEQTQTADQGADAYAPVSTTAEVATADSTASSAVQGDADASTLTDETSHSAWPAADFAAADEPEDTGDDSDAPVHLDDDAYQTPPLPQNVQGETVNLKQGGVQSINASNVTVSQGGAGRVNADNVSIEQGGVGMARAKSLTLGAGSSAFAVVANEAKIEDGSSTMILISRSIEGDVQPTIDWRSALAFGAGLGIVLSIIRRLR